MHNKNTQSLLKETFWSVVSQFDYMGDMHMWADGRLSVLSSRELHFYYARRATRTSEEIFF